MSTLLAAFAGSIIGGITASIATAWLNSRLGVEVIKSLRKDLMLDKDPLD